MSNADPIVAFVVTHTHWDREWYRPYHEFRVDLVRVVSEVLDLLEHDETFEYFVLDGQTIVLEDYLAVRPDDKSRIKRLVEQGKLAIGPWYILPDEFLVSAEATVRNLIIGHMVGSEFGAVQKVGYMPDSFGHIAQMPQILRQAEIDSFIYTRGNGAEIDEIGHEFFWRGPDGAIVLAINQCGGYCNAGALGFSEDWETNTQRNVEPERAVQQIRTLFEKMSRLSQGDVYLLNNGCDHLRPQRELSSIFEALGSAFPKTQFKHARFEHYLSEVRSRDFVKNSYSGELIGGRLQFILSGVWSARMYLKQLNDRAQTILADYVEPFSAYMHFMLGQPYEQGLVDDSWKLLLQNHPHDSICGCSTDDVHRDMVPRFDGVIQTAEQLLRDQLGWLVPACARGSDADGETVVCVGNPLPQERSDMVDRLIVLRPPGASVDRLAMHDESGRPIRFEILETYYVEHFWGVDCRKELFGWRQREHFQIYLDDFRKRIVRNESERQVRDTFVWMRFLATDIPALGHANYYLTERADDGPPTDEREVDRVAVVGNTMSSELYDVTVHCDGTFDVTDKSTGNHFEGLNRLDDSADVGDEYDYSPIDSGEVVSSAGEVGTLRVVDAGGLCGCIEVQFLLELPSAVSHDRERRVADTVECRVRTRIGLKVNDPVIDVELSFDNRAEDHRLRAVFPTTVKTDLVLSDGQFYINERPMEQPEGADWVQPPSGTYPQQEFTLQHDGSRGLAVLNRGLPEIQAVRDDSAKSSLYLTLLRSVGWLSRDDFAARCWSNAGPTIKTPDAQCIGEHTFQYGVIPLGVEYEVEAVKEASRRYRVPVAVGQGVRDGSVAGGRGLLRKSTSATSISAVKKHESRNTLVVRLYNLIGSPVDETLTLGVNVVRAWRTNLLEERQTPIDVEAPREVRLHLDPHEIVTIELELDRHLDATP